MKYILEELSSVFVFLTAAFSISMNAVAQSDNLTSYYFLQHIEFASDQFTCAPWTPPCYASSTEPSGGIRVPTKMFSDKSACENDLVATIDKLRNYGYRMEKYDVEYSHKVGVSLVFRHPTGAIRSQIVCSRILLNR